MSLTRPNIQQLSDIAGPIRTVRTIGIVVFEGFSLVQAAEIVNVFDRANQIYSAENSEERCYRCAFISRTGGRVSSSSRIDVLTQSTTDLGPVRALFVAGADSIQTALLDGQFVAWLRGLRDSAETICAIGDGRALLATIDRVPRHRASSDAETSALKRPHIGNPNASLDFPTKVARRRALDVIHQDLGLPIAQRVITQLPELDMGDMAAFDTGHAGSVKQKIHDSARWIAHNCHKSISITVAAQTAGMSERSYLRHFRAEMGIKPSEHLRRARVEMAAAMLESSDLPVDKIARRCGLTSGECLARLFRQVLHISPTEYRGRSR